MQALVNFFCWCYNSSCRKKSAIPAIIEESEVDENTPLLNPVSPNDVTNYVTNSNYDVRRTLVTSSDSEHCDSDESLDDRTNNDQTYRTNNDHAYRTNNNIKHGALGDCNENHHNYDCNHYDDERRQSARRQRRWDHFNSC